MKLEASSLLVAFGLLAAGCAHYPVNAPLAKVDSRTGYRFQNAASLTNSDRLFLMLAFSGGGARATALDYGVLEELARTQVGPTGHEHRLLDEVSVISSVSGGSFTAAYYALWGDRIFSDFEPQFLKHHVQRNLCLRVLAPWNLVRLASPNFDRSDLAAEYYDRLLFRGATFGDLAARPGAPFLFINATDETLGERFEFTQDEFDLIGSDLSQFPVARAVAASAAFPGLLTPIVVRNYSARGEFPEPEWARLAMTNTVESGRLKRMAMGLESYNNLRRRRYIHLLDGAVADNTGLRAAIDRTMLWESAGGPSSPFSTGTARRFAIIIVDAHTDRACRSDTRERSPGFLRNVCNAGGIPIRRYSFETLELFREVTVRRVREAEASRVAAGFPTEPSPYIVELHFSQLPDDSDRRFFNSVPTRLQLPPRTVDRLRCLASTELARNSEFEKLVRDLRSCPPSTIARNQ